MNSRTWLLAALLLCAGLAPARTWTSVSGATVEAEFDGFNDGQVRLKTADGRQFAIALDALSAEDQAYVQQQAPAEAAPPAEPAADAPAPAPKTEAKANAEAEAGPSFLGVAYEAVPPLEGDAVAALFGEALPDYAFYAIQYGPAASNLLYLALSPPENVGGSRRLLVHNPSAPLREKTQQIRSSRFDFPPHFSPGRREPVARLNLPRLDTRFGRAEVSHDMQLFAGINKRPELVHLVNTISLRTPAGAARLRTGGLLPNNEYLLSPGGTAKALPLAQTPEVKGSVTRDRLLVDMNMGPFRFIPLQGLGRRIEIRVVNPENQRVAMRHRIDVTLDDYINLPQQSTSPVGWTPKGLKPGTYTLKAELDLGPIFERVEMDLTLSAK